MHARRYRAGSLLLLQAAVLARAAWGFTLGRSTQWQQAPCARGAPLVCPRAPRVAAVRRRRPQRGVAGASLTAGGSGEERKLSDKPEIPTIDISAFFRDDAAGRAAAGEEVRRACEGSGMFYIVGHGLTAEEAGRALESSRALFCLSDAQKRELPWRTDNGFIRGFIGVGGESGSPTLFEAKEAYSYGYEWGPEGPPAQQLNGLVGANLWPPEESTGLGSAWRTPLMDLFDRKVAISRALTSALALAMGRQEHELLDMCKRGDVISIMRCFHYLPLSAALQTQTGADGQQEVIGSSPHTDWGWLTVILQEPGVTALQLYHSGKWWDVAPKDNALLVNVGDYVSMMTHGRFSSPLHRVVIDPTQERHSFVFFFYPSFDAGIPAVPEDASAASRYSLLSSQIPASQSSRAGGEGGGEADSAPRTFGEFITRKWAEVQRG
eukprot:Tamp_12983.p1 GENE.Tamp_12983~~Tamp_12983.p1  ORF type:complete len:437 (-),score=73.93 Tamp_12983:333-1643(-)